MVRRILPQMSTAHEAVPSSSNWLIGCEAGAAATPAPTVAARAPGPPERVPFAVTPTVGNSCARAWLTMATASRQAASEALSVWFDTSICFSSSSSLASPYTDHQSVPLAASRGSAGFQPSASLKRWGTGAEGRW